MIDFEVQPILITGAHRSGTTWAGKTLALARGLTYVSEPLHLNHSHGVFNAEVPAWYTYICEENAEQYQAAFDDLLEFRYHFGAAVKNIQQTKDIGKMIRDGANFLLSGIQNKSPLIKDPFAVFSVPWLRKSFDIRVAVMVRHPLSFVSSLKRLGWSFDFSHLLEQPLLMRDWLGPYREEMHSRQKTPEDIVGQGALLWRMIYSAVHSYQKGDPKILIVRHEDLSLEPEKFFGKMFRHFGLPFTDTVENQIRKTTRSENPDQLRKGNEHAIHLDSRANLQNWRTRLEEDEVERILRACRVEMRYFYQPEEWKSW